MDNASFNSLVRSLAEVAVSCDFSISDAESAVWDGIRDAGYTWEGKPISDAEFNEAVATATSLVKDLENYYNSVVSKYMRT